MAVFITDYTFICAVKPKVKKLRGSLGSDPGFITMAWSSAHSTHIPGMCLHCAEPFPEAQRGTVFSRVLSFGEHIGFPNKLASIAFSW